MSVIEQSVYVAVGAADAAAERVRELPAVKAVRERAVKFRETSLIDQAREIEPKVRKQAKDLAGRGETVVERARSRAKDFGGQLKDFPAEARKQAEELPKTARKRIEDLPKQIQELPKSARKQVDEVRGRINERFGGNGKDEAKKTAEKKPAAKATATAKSS
jgi:polyhydroxyalkanoate synthesis regulator phasin